MTNGRHDKLDIEKLLQNNTLVSHGEKGQKPPATKRITRHADPHIETRKVSGNVYYYYRRGIDSPVYLGNADAILQAVIYYKNISKLATSKTGGS